MTAKTDFRKWFVGYMQDKKYHTLHNLIVDIYKKNCLYPTQNLLSHTYTLSISNKLCTLPKKITKKPKQTNKQKKQGKKPVDSKL